MTTLGMRDIPSPIPDQADNQTMESKSCKAKLSVKKLAMEVTDVNQTDVNNVGSIWW